MGDLAKENGKDGNRAAQPESKEDSKLDVAAGQKSQPLMLVFKLVAWSCLLFLLSYMIWWLLFLLYYMIWWLLFLLYYMICGILVILVSVTIYKLTYHEQHDAGDQVDHNAQHIPEAPKEDHKQDQHKVDHKAQHTPEIPIEEKFEIEEDHLQAGNQLDKHPIKEERESASKKKNKKKKNKKKKKKNKKVHSNHAGAVLEGTCDATTVLLDILTGGIYSFIFGS